MSPFIITEKFLKLITSCTYATATGLEQLHPNFVPLKTLDLPPLKITTGDWIKSQTRSNSFFSSQIVKTFLTNHDDMPNGENFQLQ